MTPQRTDLTSTWLDTLSHRCRALFDHRNLTVRRSRTVHAVDWVTGLGDIEWPVPACRIGVTGFELDALVPTVHGVTCGRCLHQVKRDNVPQLDTPVAGQLTLDLVS